MTKLEVIENTLIGEDEDIADLNITIGYLRLMLNVCKIALKEDFDYQDLSIASSKLLEEDK